MSYEVAKFFHYYYYFSFEDRDELILFQVRIRTQIHIYRNFDKCLYNLLRVLHLVNFNSAAWEDEFSWMYRFAEYGNGIRFHFGRRCCGSGTMVTKFYAQKVLENGTRENSVNIFRIPV